MSLDLVKEIFSALPDCKEWHAHLLSFTHSKRNGTTYNCRRIELEPSERLSILIQDISSRYTDEGKNKLDNYVDVREYDGTCNTTTVYRIRENNPDIEIDLDALDLRRLLYLLDITFAAKLLPQIFLIMMIKLLSMATLKQVLLLMENTYGAQQNYNIALFKTM